MTDRKRRDSDRSQDVVCTSLKSQICVPPNILLTEESTSHCKRQKVCDTRRQEKDTTLLDVLKQRDVTSMDIIQQRDVTSVDIIQQRDVTSVDVLQQRDVTSVDVLQEMHAMSVVAGLDGGQQDKDSTQMSAEQKNQVTPVNVNQMKAPHMNVTQADVRTRSPHMNVTQADVRTISVQVDENTQLRTAIIFGDVCWASNLLKGGHSLSQDELDQTLISACHHGLKYIVQILVGLGANVEVKDTQENTPLMISAGNGFIDIVRFLLMNKADVNVVNSAGNTALILSIRPSGSSEMVKVLLGQEGIDINHQNRYGYTVLMKAMEVKDISTIKILMELSNLKFKSHDYSPCVSVIDRLNNKLTELDEPTNFKGESAQQIAEKCGLGDVFQTFNKYRQTGVNPLIVATETRNTEVFNILLNCQFLENRDKAAIEAFIQIFKQLEAIEVKIINDNEREMIKRLLECGADRIRDNEPLSIAVNMGNYSLVKLLCKYLFRAQSQRFIDREVLETAVKSGRCDIIELLLKYKTDINQANYLGSLLDNTLIYGQIECAKILIQHGAQMDIIEGLQSAVDHQAVKYMDFIFDNYKQDILHFATIDMPRLSKLLIQAVQGGSLKIIGHLIDAGADVNVETATGQMPLSESENGEVVKYLVSRGADVNHVTAGGKPPLLNVLVNRYKSSVGYDPSTLTVVKVLLDSLACVNGRGKDGRTALMEARSVDMIKLLLDYDADINQQDEVGDTALMIAVIRRDFDTVNELIIAGSDVNCHDNLGFSPLMTAVQFCTNDIVKILLDAGADVNAVQKNKNTKTALTCLTEEDFWEKRMCTMETLLKRGAITSYVKPHVVHKIIIHAETNLIPQLIRGGRGAADVDVRFDPDLRYVLRGYDISTVSPLCVALLVGNVSLARYFVRNLFLTNSDVTSLARNTNLRRFLQKAKLEESVEFLDEMSSQPLSLFKLAFVTVSSAVGTSPGREIRVDNLPLPQVIKDRLIFKYEDSNGSRPRSGFHGILSDLYRVDWDDPDYWDDDDEYVDTDTD